MATAGNSRHVPEALIDKIGALPLARIAEVEDFIGQREHQIAVDRPLRDAARDASMASFARVWSNPEDDAYDAV